MHPHDVVFPLKLPQFRGPTNLPFERLVLQSSAHEMPSSTKHSSFHAIPPLLAKKLASSSGSEEGGGVFASPPKKNDIEVITFLVIVRVGGAFTDLRPGPVPG